LAGFLLPAFVSVTIGAASSAEIPVPTDPVAKLAFDVLDKHCSRCHQDGKLTKRQTPAKNFGNVLKLEELASNASMIQPGNPYGSKLFKQIVDKEMPYDVIYEGASVPGPSEADVKALETWIQSLGTSKVAGCTARPFVGNKDIVNLIAADLENRSSAPRGRAI